MRAFLIDGYEPRDGGRIADIPDPVPRQGQVSVRVHAAGALSSPTRHRAKRRGVDHSFLFMRADGAQLAEITTLIEDGTIRPVLDRTFPFASTRDAIGDVEAGRTKGNVVVTM